jgi:hypothetical protein
LVILDFDSQNILTTIISMMKTATSWTTIQWCLGWSGWWPIGIPSPMIESNSIECWANQKFQHVLPTPHLFQLSISGTYPFLKILSFFYQKELLPSFLSSSPHYIFPMQSNCLLVLTLNFPSSSLFLPLFC